jgi:hypothetical protein
MAHNAKAGGDQPALLVKVSSVCQVFRFTFRILILSLRHLREVPGCVWVKSALQGN